MQIIFDCVGRNVTEAIKLQPYCVFTDWSFKLNEICDHCERLENGIEIDMYRQYRSKHEMSKSNQLDMLYRLSKKYALFYRIYEWCNQL